MENEWTKEIDRLRKENKELKDKVDRLQLEIAKVERLKKIIISKMKELNLQNKEIQNKLENKVDRLQLAVEIALEKIIGARKRNG